MSGIAGIVAFNGATVEREQLRRMVARAAYRGRDGAAYLCRGPVGLVGLALHSSSAPTSVGGGGAAETLCEGGRNAELALVCDARIDNRDDCAALAAADPPRVARSSEAVPLSSVDSDAELILAMMQLDREQAPARLIGDFAYAFWDGLRMELRLARDPLGMRSLYYRVEANRVLFATELKQILALSEVPRKLNEHAVAWHLAGMQVPPGCAFYDGIEELRPGEEVAFRPSSDGRVETRRRVFWEPDPDRRIRYRRETEYAEHLRELLIDSISSKLRVRSPAGVSLSGGMDSATVASLAGMLGERGGEVAEMRAYSWAFTELSQCDERENIRRITDRYGIPVREIPAEETWPLAEYPLHGPHEDDPFCSMFQAFIDRVLSTAAADGVSTMFYGNRGDVMCGGSVNDLPGLLRSGAVATAWAELRELARIATISRARAAARFVVRPLLSDLLPRRLALRVKGAAASGPAGGPVARAAPHVSRAFLERAGLPPQDPVQTAADRRSGSAARDRYRHVFSPLVMRGVQYLERLCAGFELGFADPWSDRRIAEFVLACPQYVLDRAGDVKRLPKRAMHGIIPAAALSAARKVPPEPLYLLALRGKAYDTVIDLITGSRCAEAGFIDGQALRKRYERFVRGEEPVFDLWSTLSLEAWLRRYW